MYTDTNIEGETWWCGTAYQPVQLTGNSGRIANILNVVAKRVVHGTEACEASAGMLKSAARPRATGIALLHRFPDALGKALFST